MTFAEAQESLLFHSCAHSNYDNPRWANGFLGSLRPYAGLREENFHEVMQAIITVAPHFHGESRIDKELVSNLWSICYFGRSWGLDPDGMLRGNKLIAPEDVVRLSKWIGAIEWATLILIGGEGDYEGVLQEALAEYHQATAEQ